MGVSDVPRNPEDAREALIKRKSTIRFPIGAGRSFLQLFFLYFLPSLPSLFLKSGFLRATRGGLLVVVADDGEGFSCLVTLLRFFPVFSRGSHQIP